MNPMDDMTSAPDRQPSLDLIRTFLFAQRAGSMTRAAAELGISQAAVSGQISRLEAEVGLPLFTRTPRGLDATSAGAELAARVAPHLDALHDAVVAASGRSGPVFGRAVAIGGPPELMEVRILPALAALFRQGLKIRVETGLADELLRRLTTGALDSVVSTVRPRRRGVVSSPIADEQFALVAAPSAEIDVKLLAEDPRSALAAVPAVAYSADQPIIRRYWRHVFGLAPPAAEPAVIVADLRAVRSAVRAGAGFSVLPEYLIVDDLADGTLVRLIEPEDVPINTFYLARRGAAVPTVAVEAVEAALRAQARHW